MLVEDMSNEDYHAHPAISSSAVKTISTKSILHWKNAVYKDNSAFDLGTAVHAMVLEPEKDLVLCGPENRRGKLWTSAREEAQLEGKTLLTQEDYAICLDMVSSVMSNSAAVELVSDLCAVKEVSIFGTDEETGLALKARPDIFIPERGILVDLKTTRDASPKRGGFERQFFSLGYHIQAAFYKYVLELAGYPIEDFIFLAVEKEPPYAVQIHNLHSDVIDEGLYQVKKVLRQIKDAGDSDTESTGWPSQNTILLPKWMKATDRIDDMTDHMITDVEALWPRIDRTYRFDQAEKRSVPCDPLDDGSSYTIQFRMTSAKAKELFTHMAKAYSEAREEGWPEQIEVPFKKDEETGTYTGKATIKGAYGKEATRKPNLYDAGGNKLPEEFLLTTGSTVNVAVAFFPYNMREAGVSLRLRAVQVIKYVEMEERNPFGAVEGYVHNSDANPFKPEPLIDEDEVAEVVEESVEAPVEKVIEKAPPLKVVKSKAASKTKPKAGIDEGFSNIIDNWD